jgi:hypothetical protein
MKGDTSEPVGPLDFHGLRGQGEKPSRLSERQKVRTHVRIKRPLW